MNSESNSVSGTVVHIRKVSKKIAFFDVEPSDSDKQDKRLVENGSISEGRITIVIKSWEAGDNLSRSISSKNKIHVGDLVTFRGYFENRISFSAKTYVIDQLWSNISPGVNFLPKPPSDKKLSTKRFCRNDDLEESACKYFLNTGKCPKPVCHFKHEENRNNLVKDRFNFVSDKKRKKLLVHEDNYVGEVVGNSQRASVFSKWIVEKFSLEYLKSGVILDIGGGRGDLSFELGTKHQLQCVIVDPRPQKFKRWQLKFLKKNPLNVTAHHIQDYFTPEFFEKHNIDIQSVRLVLGLHPDEVTELIVDISLTFKLSFAVIPCCVFSQDFPHRILKNGKTPSSYEDFCQYLCEKDSGITEHLLSFLGKNKVLFFMR